MFNRARTEYHGVCTLEGFETKHLFRHCKQYHIATFAAVDNMLTLSFCKYDNDVITAFKEDCSR